ncbi:unnamed protein product [Diatraea saccharalis]|uniref:Uncharacterized protein n=1 Tax=Diatraea saccharalis TaxID=40085 RepID=A0A9N9R6U1_9NEOP|nr:unnamed protein product [Diatraea saccharalis]
MKDITYDIEEIDPITTQRRKVQKRKRKMVKETIKGRDCLSLVDWIQAIIECYDKGELDICRMKDITYDIEEIDPITTQRRKVQKRKRKMVKETIKAATAKRRMLLAAKGLAWAAWWAVVSERASGGARGCVAVTDSNLILKMEDYKKMFSKNHKLNSLVSCTLSSADAQIPDIKDLPETGILGNFNPSIVWLFAQIFLVKNFPNIEKYCEKVIDFLKSSNSDVMSKDRQTWDPETQKSTTCSKTFNAFLALIKRNLDKTPSTLIEAFIFWYELYSYNQSQ